MRARTPTPAARELLKSLVRRLPEMDDLPNGDLINDVAVTIEIERARLRPIMARNRLADEF